MAEKLAKEGWLHKKGSRMHRWLIRYFVLNGGKLSYKLKPDAKPDSKGELDLQPGCIVTQVQEDSTGLIMGKKLYVFWIIWPQDKDSKAAAKHIKDDEDHDDHNNDNDHDETRAVSPTKIKDLKQIVESEVMTQRREQKRAAEQLERHQAHDSNVRVGMKVAAVAVGGVVIGALTAGIGLVPYVTVVGLTAVAGGAGVLYTYRRPANSRLILASESMDDAVAWKRAIEAQVSCLEGQRKYGRLPPSTDPTILREILGFSGSHSFSRPGADWSVCGHVEGMRILSHSCKESGQRYRRAQVTVNSSPLSAFLALMDTSSGFWPKAGEGSLKVVHTMDDHADVLGLEAFPGLMSLFPRPGHGWTSRLRSGAEPGVLQTALNRFWRLDDDGSYLIAMNSTTHADFPLADSASPLHVMIIFTIAPRKDHSSYDSEIKETLITCTVQVQKEGVDAVKHSIPLKKKSFQRESDAIDVYDVCMDSLVMQLLDVRESLVMSRFHDNSSNKHKFFDGTPEKLSSNDSKDDRSIQLPRGKQLSDVSVLTAGSTAGSQNETKSKLSTRWLKRHGSYDDSKAQASDSRTQVTESIESSSTSSRREGPVSRLRGRFGPSRTRNQHINERAAVLRCQIDAKDFEVHVLEKLISRAGREGAQAHSRELLVRMESQLRELKELQTEYHFLTGSNHEVGRAKRRKGLLGLLGGGASKSAAAVAAATFVNDPQLEAGAAGKAEVGTSTHTPASSAVPLPLHWEYSLVSITRELEPKKRYLSPPTTLEYCGALLRELFTCPTERSMRQLVTVLTFAMTFFSTFILIENMKAFI